MAKTRKNFKVFSPLESIAAITQHIPERSFQLCRYYGYYSNRMRGDRKKQKALESDMTSPNELEVIDIGNYKLKRIPMLIFEEFLAD